ncbi:MAG: ELKS/Rab6-interacting/CAST family protein [Candidatus Omnitrophica bacterium]|nr:ELKS/Rab6-interacting/CAST family protein [Candidatus Omnitrophota bacterium]
MNKKKALIFLIAALFCTSIFLGCASIPQEALDEKEAIIQNLNGQIDSLRQEITQLKSANIELTKLNMELTEKLKGIEKAQKSAVEGVAETGKIK